MNNLEILRIAMEQSAIDCGAKASDFLEKENLVVISQKNLGAKKYFELPFICNLVSYGNNIVASVDREYEDIVREYINKYPVEHCFETPNMYVLNDKLKEKGMGVCFVSEYFLPDMNLLKLRSCNYEVRVLQPEDFKDLYKEEWSNALCEKRKELDILAIGAYDGGKLIGLAGCSADCENMWQIGIDVLPEYRKQGIASALTSTLTLETLKRGKVPFYCAAWSNIKSVRNAIKCGFKPSWVELNVKEISFIEKMNK